jgi:SAM-dependent methyltransferase
VASAQLRESLVKFVSFAGKLKGDEKGEAQAFLDHFFRALGHDGVIEAGATYEFRIAKKPGSAQLELIKGEAAKPKGGKKFADLLWPERVLIEMKSRGQNLEKHYDQVFDYWTHIVPKRPPYVVLCNFDEFWIYDFNIQLFDPVDRISMRELPTSSSAFNFLLPNQAKPVFGNNRVEVTRKAADAFADAFRQLIARKEDRSRAQRFILQLLVSVVAEDLCLLPDNIVTSLLADCVEKPAESYDLLGGLFRQMADPGKARGGRFADVPYFNGGLFAVVDPVTLKYGEAFSLHHAAQANDWSQVKPEIFGTLFQHSMDAKERHAFGAHFTSEFDIQKVVGPTIVRPWRERIEAAGKDPKALVNALEALRRFRVLDPACGSGNFLFVAYREMKRLERDLLIRLQRIKAKIELASAVSIQQFHGIDNQPFAVELAKVTLMLAKELEIREADRVNQSEGLFFQEKPLPLDNLDANIRCADALFTEWPQADAIIGNPPYLDARKLALEHGDAYVKKVRGAYPDVPGRADFCVYWFRKAHDHLEAGGRAGLVGTNTVRQNYSREGGLDYIVAYGGTITNAVSTQVWSGDAQVHVSIVNWIKGDMPGDKVLTLQRGDSVDSPWDTYKLDRINSALSPGLDVSAAIRLEINAKSTGCFEGQQPGHDGFRLSADDATRLINQGCGQVIYPYLNGDELLGEEYVKAPRFIIDFGERDTFAARQFDAAMQIIRQRVLSDWEKNAAKEKAKTGKDSGEHQNRLRTWWQLKRQRKAMITAIEKLPRYTVCVRHTKRPIFEFLDSQIRPDSSFTVFPLADDYSFGILQSGIHFSWFTARCSTIKADFRYTSDTVFDTFPWPQAPKKKQIAEVAATAVALRALRLKIMTELGYSLRELYRTLEEPGANPLRDAHARLDTAVRAVYGMPAVADPLAFLLDLNLSLAAKEKKSESITPPGLPLPAADQAAFITCDCVHIDM